jgi:pimeloyl-ACP methyl ester carboxylesterase
VYQDTARTLAELIPNSEVFEMGAVRHWPHFEDPEAFNAAAVEFLSRR